MGEYYQPMKKFELNLSSTTPWINECISRNFSVGGGWGLGWANREYQGFMLLKSYIDKLKVGAVLNKREILG